MKTKEISVSVRYVKNLGNYQSFTAEAGIVAEIEPSETEEDAFRKAWDAAKKQISEQILALKKESV